MKPTGRTALSPGAIVPLAIEKPAAGGAMIARFSGQVVLVEGTIPGERVTARIHRLGKGVAHAAVTRVEEPSPDRRNVSIDPRCGGSLYAHIAYPRQIELKAQLIADAFARIGRVTLPAVVPVAPSPENGYRMRARLHRRLGRVGFFLEGTHEVCDARWTGQLLPKSCDVIEDIAQRLQRLDTDAVREIDISENIEASGRVVHLETATPARASAFLPLAGLDGVTGLTIGMPLAIVQGNPYVTDALSLGRHPIVLRRHVRAFFQGNRHLLRALVARVVECVEPGSTVVDLYAGTGVFAVAAAVTRGARVTAVEGDRVAAQDLAWNAAQAAGSVTAVQKPVEEFRASANGSPGVVIVDPPRTGMSPEAMDAVVRLDALRLVYVSCDVATLARDSRRLLDRGYGLERVEAFDLFPNTPHVEAIVVFRK
jgi:23S rRNA (uracil1939-C5)-methyltransferase